MNHFQRLPVTTNSHIVLIHPLLNSNALYLNNKYEQNKIQKDDIDTKFLDPLGAASPNVLVLNCLKTTKEPKNGVNPLNNTLLIESNNQVDDEQNWEMEELLVGFRHWNDLKKRILDKFKTDVRLTLQSTFLYLNEGTDKEDERIVDSSKQGQKQLLLSSVIGIKNKRHSKGEQSSVNSIKLAELTQEEWVRKLGELRSRLKILWRNEKRLDCIKLISELLAHLSADKTTYSSQFYPAQFVYITDLLDFFARLVWLRLLECAQEERSKAGLGDLPIQWTTVDILEGTRLKARNWFGKINQMVKLPSSRIYMLAAILPCQRFMDPWPQAAQQNALELCNSVSNIVKHPLISIYLRCYICRVSMRIQPTDKAPHWKCLNDWLQTFDSQPPCSLLWPAIEWIIQCAAYRAVIYEDLHPLWEYCRRVDKRPIVLIPLLNALSRLYFGEYALEICKIVVTSELVTGEELCALGSRLLEIDVPSTAKKTILRSSWKCVQQLGSIKEYLSCCDYWCQFVVKYFTKFELEVMLEHIFRKLQHDKYEPHYVQLLSIWSNIFNQSIQIKPLIEMDIFSKFFIIFRSAPCTFRVEAAKVVLNAIVKRHEIGEFKDINDAHQIFSVCQLLHDSLELSALSDQIIENTRLICFALDRISSFQIEQDPEKYFDFLVDCRANLNNWDILQRWTIRRVQSLTLYIARKVKFSSSRAAFIQGCLANQFVSIPSLSDPLDRVELSIQSAHIALIALAFVQVDSFIIFALEQISTLQISSFCDSRFLQIEAQFLSLLLNIPIIEDDYEVNNDERRIPFKYFNSFLDFILSYQFQDNTLFKISLITFQAFQIFLLNKCLQFLLIFKQQQNNNENYDNFIFENIQRIIDLIGSEFTEKDNLIDNEFFYSSGMELLELNTYFNREQLFSNLFILAKQIYKIIRHIPSFSLRLQKLKHLSKNSV